MAFKRPRVQFSSSPPEFQPPVQTASGTIKVSGRVKGYISGMVDADFNGVVHGDFDASVSSDGEITTSDQQITTEGGSEDE